ncbi:MAG: hypothetical protein MUC42_07720 [Bryobacter sp.]|nr:hypothetical protein [Bryobacter sp.]
MPEFPDAPVWTDWIKPATLLDQVSNTAPFLFPLPPAPPPLRNLGAHPHGYLRILAAAPGLENRALTYEEQVAEYFALCLAAHYATVATFVPTDVDSKIRGLIWKKTPDRDVLRSMAGLALDALAWDLIPVSRRETRFDHRGPVSGHHGEWFSVIAGAHGRFTALGDLEYAEKLASALDAELAREAAVFLAALATPGAELDTLRLAMSITHNLGDLDQGISFWDKREALHASRRRFARLAHENTQPYDGAFQLAAALYRELLSSEGHRHYPLRSVRCLRRSADLLLPLGPFLDDWGALLAAHPALNPSAHSEILEALVTGCRKVSGQHGYYRALAGLFQGFPQVFHSAARSLGNAAQKDLKSADLRQRIAIPRASFESRYRKRVQSMREKMTTSGKY